jgi:hydrogenase-4 component F
MTYHSLAKPVAFFSAGTLAQLHKSSNFDEMGSGTFGRAPVASGLLVIAAIMITGSPPFGLFFSEMIILKAGFSGPHVVATSIFLGTLAMLFCGMAFQIGRLVLGAPRAPQDGHVPEHEWFDLGMAVAIATAVVASVSAFYLPRFVVTLIHAATQVLGGGA